MRTFKAGLRMQARRNISDMRKRGIGENIGTGDRSAMDISVGYW